MKLLTITKGITEIAKVQLNRPFLTLGRSPSCDVVLRAPKIKPVHFILEWSGTGDFSTEKKHAGSWVLFEIDESSEGAVIGATKVNVLGLSFKITEDRLASKEVIGGKMVSGLKQPIAAGRAIPTGAADTLELVHVRSDSGAVESVAYIRQKEIKRSKASSVFQTFPQFKIKGTKTKENADSCVLSFEAMPDAEIYVRGKQVKMPSAAASDLLLQRNDVYHIKWNGQEVFARWVSPIFVPPLDRAFLGDAVTKKVYFVAGLSFIVIFLIAYLAPVSIPVKEPPPKRMAKIEIQQPVIPPPAPPPPPPPPKVIEKPAPVVKAAPAGPAAPGPAAPEPAPTKKIAKSPPPKPAKQKLPPKAQAARPTAPQPTQAQAEKAQVTKSLSFLSFSNSAATKSVKVNTPNPSGASNLAVASNLRGKSNAGANLEKEVTSGSDITGPLETRGSRSYGNGPSVANLGSERSGSGQVLGRTGVRGGRGNGGGGGLTGAVGAGGGGLMLSGNGTASTSEIEKAIQKAIHKLQYCYEKALLADSDIGGSVEMVWVIAPGGRANNVRVKNSQIRNAGMMTCIRGEIAKIKFPSPSGGSVEVEYPFSFSSSKI